MLRSGLRRARHGAGVRAVLSALAFLFVVGLSLPVVAQETPPDSPYFPQASPVWEIGSSWVRDKDTGNDDGLNSPGERVEPRLVLRNNGSGTSKNVTATLTITDTDITVVTDTVTIDEFAAGSGGVTLVGFEVDISGSATEHDVAATVSVESTNAADGVDEPAVFSIVIPIINAEEPSFGRRSEWTFDGDLGNGDGIASPGETVEPRVRIRNDGPGSAANVTVTLTSGDALGVLTSSVVTHTSWPASEARNNEGLVLVIDEAATPGTQIPLTVEITADNGGPWEFTYNVLVLDPLITFSERSSWIFDGSDGVANSGERVEPRLRIKNDGTGDALNVVTTVTTSASDVTIVTDSVAHGTWPQGEARNNDGIVLDIASDATAQDVTLTYTVTADNATTQTFTFTFGVVVPSPSFSQRSSWARDKDTGNGDGDANPGERLELKARLKNDGPGAGTNVVATLTTTDTDITIVTGTVTHTSWPAGEARNNDGFVFEVDSGATAHDVTFTVSVTADLGGPWSFTVTVPIVEIPVVLAERSFWARDKVTGNNDGLKVDIASDATGTAAFVLDVTADNGGPWQFTYTLTITPSAAAFEQRTAWARDKTTGNNNGFFEAGEQLEIRARMQNVGQTDATNVAVVLSTSDANVTVSSNTVNHTTWAAGAALNNVGLLVDLGGSYSATSMAFTATVTADVGGPWTFNYTISTPQTAPAALAIPSDIDMDGAVDIRDILGVATVYGEPASAYPSADVNGDAVLDIGDMVVIHADRTDVVATAPGVRVGRVTLVERWLRDARQQDDGSRLFRDGLPALEGLLAALRPATTALLPNYPNPFNPETWIPFDLADAGEVTIRVYDVGGQVVRRLDLGYIDAGKYHARDAAAYWDGRNESGEGVASGVYLYEIRAGEQRDIRRMVVRK